MWPRRLLGVYERNKKGLQASRDIQGLILWGRLVHIYHVRNWHFMATEFRCRRQERCKHPSIYLLDQINTILTVSIYSFSRTRSTTLITGTLSLGTAHIKWSERHPVVSFPTLLPVRVSFVDSKVRELFYCRRATSTPSLFTLVQAPLAAKKGIEASCIQLYGLSLP